jgi:hypothetical protein
MAQIIKHRRGSLSQIKDVTARVSELIMATGSIGDLNGPMVFIGSDDGVAGGYKAVSKIYQGTTAPTISVGSHGSTIDGTPFYASGDKSLYILDKNGNSQIDLTGNIEGNTISGVTITNLSGTTATFDTINLNTIAFTGLTAGRVVYVGNTGSLQDDGDFNWDSGSNQLGISGSIKLNSDAYIYNDNELIIEDHINGVNIKSNNYAQLESNGSYVWVDNGGVHIEGNTYTNIYTNNGNVDISSYDGGTLNLNTDGGEGNVNVLNGGGNQLVINGDTLLTGSLFATKIEGTGSLYLQPDQNDGRYFEIYNSGASDVHIKSNQGLSFFGDDTNYLLINDYAQTVTVNGVNGVILNTHTSVYSGLTVTGSVNISGNTSMTGSLVVSNGAAVIDQGVISQNSNVLLTSGSNLIIQDFGNLQVAGDAAISGALFVSGNIYQTGSFYTQGSIVLSGSINIGDFTGDTVNFNGEVTSNILPQLTNQYDLGSSGQTWANVWGNTGHFDTLNLGTVAFSGLTEGRVVLVGPNGSLIDSSSFTYSGGTLTNNGDIHVLNGHSLYANYIGSENDGNNAYLDLANNNGTGVDVRLYNNQGGNSNIYVEANSGNLNLVAGDGEVSIYADNTKINMTGSIHLTGDADISGSVYVAGGNYVYTNNIYDVNNNGVFIDSANYTEMSYDNEINYIIVDNQGITLTSGLNGITLNSNDGDLELNATNGSAVNIEGSNGVNITGSVLPINIYGNSVDVNVGAYIGTLNLTGSAGVNLYSDNSIAITGSDVKLYADTNDVHLYGDDNGVIVDSQFIVNPWGNGNKFLVDTSYTTVNNDLVVTGTTSLTGSVFIQTGSGLYVSKITDSMDSNGFSDGLKIIGNSGSLHLSSSYGVQVNESSFAVQNVSANGNLTSFEVKNNTFGDYDTYVYNILHVSGNIETSGSLKIGTNLNVSGSTSVTGAFTVSSGSMTSLGGDLYVSGNLQVLGSQTNVNLQSNTVDIGDNIILVNAYSPFQRYAGIAGNDSGSAGNSGSLLWDSLNDYWLFVNSNGSASKMIGTTTGSFGYETSLTSGTFPIATGAGTIGDSLLTYSGTTLAYNNNKFTVNSDNGDTSIFGNVTLSNSGSLDTGGATSAIVFRNSTNGLGYVGTADSQAVTTQLLGYKTSDGSLTFSSVIDGGQY